MTLKKSKLVIIGAGQQGRNCKRLAHSNGFKVVAFIDDYENGEVEGVKIYQRIESIKGYNSCKYIIAIGDNSARKKYIKIAEQLNLEFANIIDPEARIEKGARIGVGNYIYKLAIIYASACVGNHNIINAKAMLATDAVIGNNCDLRFGCNICGAVCVGDNSTIGYNATISSGNVVGKNCIIEANSVVYHNVPDGSYESGVCKDIKNEVL